jgi:phosphatidylglycerophosphate synthase
MFTSRNKNTLNRVFEPPARWLGSIGISPSALTMATPILASVVAVWFVHTRAILPFCLLFAAVSLLDALDGALARATHRVTRFGAYLDAVCDRYVEAIEMLAVAVVTGHWALMLVALSGSFLVSYAKARAGMELPVSNLEWPDLMERTERTILFLGGLALSALVPWRPLGQDLFWWTLVLFSVLVHVTVIQRILRARRFLQSR